MALEKIITEDKIEIVGPFKVLHIRTKTSVLEDGSEISSSFHRHTVVPGEDVSSQSPDVQGLSQLLHTPELIAEYEASLETPAE